MNPAISPRRDQYGTSADETLLDQYLRLRQHTQALVARLNHEDMAVQPTPDASPVKWHLAHTTWFFETFLLSTGLPGYRQFDPSFGYLAANGRPRIGFFPGSTIGNFDGDGAVRFLRSTRQVLGDRAALLVGVDLVKDEATLSAAYDDSQGVTARFNKNLLIRINRELGGDFDPEAFDHLALWNPVHSRMEMHLVSRKDQIVNAAGHTFAFRRGERLHTENSHKFTTDSFAQLAARAGWSVANTWISDEPRVAMFRLEPIPSRIPKYFLE